MNIFNTFVNTSDLKPNAEEVVLGLGIMSQVSSLGYFTMGDLVIIIDLLPLVELWDNGGLGGLYVWVWWESLGSLRRRWDGDIKMSIWSIIMSLAHWSSSWMYAIVKGKMFTIATAPFLCCDGLVASCLLSKPVGLSSG